AAELLDAGVVLIPDVNVAGSIGGDAIWSIELPVAGAERAPLGEVGAGDAELLDAVVALVRDVDVAGGVGGDADGSVELPVAAARRAPGEQEGSWRVCERSTRSAELLNARVAGIGDVDVPGRVDRQGRGTAELPVAAT